jgi:hypothetical protein
VYILSHVVHRRAMHRIAISNHIIVGWRLHNDAKADTVYEAQLSQNRGRQLPLQPYLEVCCFTEDA